MKLSRPVGSTLSTILWVHQDNVPSNGGTWGIASRNTANLGIFNLQRGQDVMTMLPNGNVGIGTVAPGQLLELVRDDGDVAMRFHDPGNVWYSLGTQQSAGGVFFLNRGASPGEFADLTVNPSNGNVGIGTAWAPDLLTVAGPINVNGVRVIDGTGRWVGSPTGLQGPVGPMGPMGPTGPVGPQGPAGPAVHTSALCVNNVPTTSNCGTRCPNGIAAQTLGNPCTVTSETGMCSAANTLPPGSFGPPVSGLCCVCIP
ncbi:MAG TPA: hypothetical protein VFU13_20150 [Steroidobacteraceae bacterium]|nr:hypothetical protein [Steroidobacteraceae bacterium]